MPRLYTATLVLYTCPDLEYQAHWSRPRISSTPSLPIHRAVTPTTTCRYFTPLTPTLKTRSNVNKEKSGEAPISSEPPPRKQDGRYPGVPPAATRTPRLHPVISCSGPTYPIVDMHAGNQQHPHINSNLRTFQGDAGERGYETPLSRAAVTKFLERCYITPTGPE